MGVNKFGIGRLMPGMSTCTECTDSSVAVRRGQDSGELSSSSSTTSPLHIFNGGQGTNKPQEDKMRLKMGQDELVTGLAAEHHSGNLANFLVKTGISNELSMSLPNLTAALDTELLNKVNERNVRSSLSNIFDSKSDSTCNDKNLSVSELSNCIKTLSTEDCKMLCDNPGEMDFSSHRLMHQGGLREGVCHIPPKLNSEDITIEMNGGNNRLSAVLENIPLLYIPHTKQLVSLGSPQGSESNGNSSKSANSSSSPSSSCSPTSPVPLGSFSIPSTDHTRQIIHKNQGDTLAVTPTKSVENGLSTPNPPRIKPLTLSLTSPNTPQNSSPHEPHLDDSLTSLLPNSEPDGSFALSQDSDASSTCKSEQTVIHHEGATPDEDDLIRPEFEDVSLDRLSKESIDKDSPKNSLERTNTIGSLSRTDASSFSSISSISTATDFSASAASCSDDYLELRSGGGEVDESGFMEVNLHSSNTYERTKNGSHDSGIDEKQGAGAKAKRKGISSFFARSLFSRKPSKESVEAPVCTATPAANSAPGWKLFGRVPLKQTSQKDTREITKDYQCKGKTASGITRTKKPGVEAPSTTALILENRPSHLPSKDPEEESRHKMEYEAMVEASKKRELREAKLRKKREQQQLKQEEALAAAHRVWNQEILPNWENSKNTKKSRDLWWQGIPPAVRGKVWQLAIGNELNLTPELYEICLNRAKDRLKLMQESGDSDSICSQVSEPSSSKEASVEVIKLDVSRTFPQLCIFQKGGPYHELLQGLLGAYACYRPDVGYVQGMSFIAAVLLLNMEVNDAFICFANLLNRPCQIAFFRLDESLMKSYFSAYEEFFRENLPKLYNHFQKQSLTPDLYIIDWMFTLYAKSLPLDVASRVWDVFCRDGEEFLFRTALGILRLYEDILLSLDFIHLAQFLTKLPENISSEQLFKAIDSISMSIEKKRFVHVLSQFREPKET